MNFNSPMPDDTLPPDLTGIEGALDTLAAREHAAVPRGLASRVHAATLPALRSPADVDIVYAFHAARAGGARVDGARVGGARVGLAMAAALALLATVGAVWLSSLDQSGLQQAGLRRAGVPTTIITADAELEAWFALADLPEAQETDAFDQLEADAEAVARAVSGSWMPDDLFNAESSTEDSL